MGRDRGRPHGYAPFLELYIRRKVEGGKVRAPGVLRGPMDARARRACLVLVHGFNNTDSQGSEAYLGFRNRQTELTGAPPFTFDRYFGDAFWPGDADYWWVVDLADFLVYPTAVKRARETAVQLAHLLWSLPSLERVDFIAHSLGCRVVLETLELMRDRALPRVERVCLMAAAVPAEMLQPGGRFADLLGQLQAEGTKLHVLHSKKDIVLHGAFPPGQLLAGEPSVHALGRDGPNELMPGYGSTLTHHPVSGAGHSHYWGHNRTDASDQATRLAGEFLSLGDTTRVVGERRDLFPAMDAIEARRLGALRRAFDRIS